MPCCRVKPVRYLRGKIVLPGDKSIAHRSIIISAITKGKTYIYNFPANQDCLITLKAFKKLGVRISKNKISRINKGSSHIDLCIEGRGLYGLAEAGDAIFVGQSGTTIRLSLGVLAGQKFSTTLTASKALSHRPMKRVTEPLRKMGAVIKARKTERLNKLTKHRMIEEYLPITIKGGSLQGIRYRMPVASAQVKSALLLAGLYAKGNTQIFEPIKTRDHTERMLKDFKAEIKIRNKIISIRGSKQLFSPGRIDIPGDISSAAFFIVAAILLPHSYLTIKSVSLNPARLGLIRVLKRMGADIRIIPSGFSGGEPLGDILVKNSRLKATSVKQSEVPQLIDEIPILMLAACFATGKTTIYGVRELRVKETDRIASMQTNLNKMGAEVRITGQAPRFSKAKKENIIIQGTGRLKGARVSSFNDHRTAMTMIIAGLVCAGGVIIDDVRCIAKSFPGFLKILKSIIK